MDKGIGLAAQGRVKWRPGTVIPSIHNDEWTFTYFLDGIEVRHEEWSNRTFTKATAAKQAMRDFIEEMRLHDLP